MYGAAECIDLIMTGFRYAGLPVFAAGGARAVFRQGGAAGSGGGPEVWAEYMGLLSIDVIRP